MMGFVPIGLLTLALIYIVKCTLGLRRHAALAKTTGLPYHLSLTGIGSLAYPALEALLVPFLSSLPYIKNTRIPVLFTVHRGWYWKQRMREQLGEIYIIATPWSLYLNSSDADANMQLLTRTQGFAKPLEFYALVDIFGSSIVSTEGDTWKRHRKIVAPAFAERNNLLVWQESLRQASGMLNFWSNLKGNTKAKMTVDDVGHDTAHLALNVLSGAAFGVSQLWQGENESLLGDNIIPGFNTTKLIKGHTYTFQAALQELISGVVWLILIPEWLLKHSPFGVHKRVLIAYAECTNYFNELRVHKADLLEKGNLKDGQPSDIMVSLVKASQDTPEESNGVYLTNQEVMADSWLLLFAGHETTANTLHYTLTFLAIELNTQAKLQKQIDNIVGSRPQGEWTYEKDMGRLYNSLVGASFMEALRLTPPVIAIPKVCRGYGPQFLRIDGKDHFIPLETFIHADGSSVQRHPKYWPHSKSVRTAKDHDLDDFIPQRWFSSTFNPASKQDHGVTGAAEIIDGLERVSYESSGSGSLLTPIKGAFMPFAEGPRGCPGRRFAQVELTAALTSIFHEYTVELSVSRWASDEQVDKMGKAERRAVYQKAVEVTRKVIDGSVSQIALKMMTTCPLRFVKRGEERFMDCYL